MASHELDRSVNARIFDRILRRRGYITLAEVCALSGLNRASAGKLAEAKAVSARRHAGRLYLRVNDIFTIGSSLGERIDLERFRRNISVTNVTQEPIDVRQFGSKDRSRARRTAAGLETEQDIAKLIVVALVEASGAPLQYRGQAKNKAYKAAVAVVRRLLAEAPSQEQAPAGETHRGGSGGLDAAEAVLGSDRGLREARPESTMREAVRRALRRPVDRGPSGGDGAVCDEGEV